MDFVWSAYSYFGLNSLVFLLKLPRNFELIFERC